MASVTTEPATAQSHSGPRRGRRGGGGDNLSRRGRGEGGRGGGGGGGGRELVDRNAAREEGRGAPLDARGAHTHRRPRGRTGGTRGGGGRNVQQRDDAPDANPLPNAEDTKRTSIFGEPGELPAETTAAKPDADDAASDPDLAVCFICADPVKYSSIAPCNHVICHICSLRMRALYKNKACAHCRTEADFVIFSKFEDKRFVEFKDDEIVSQNDALGIKYDDQSICDDTTLLLRYNCPDADCDRACLGWPDLHQHVRNTHNKVLCDLCTRYKKVFTHEHTLFTPHELHQHERKGDDKPGSDNQSGFKGHPECEFCCMRFYSSDELYEHCRDRHERCHICDRRSSSHQQQYYINYDALAIHFRKEHFMCADEECLERKFVVFESEIDLKAHQLEVHPNGLSKAARKDARRIDMSNFDAGAYHSHRDGGRRRRRGGGQQEEEAPIRTEQQMSRAELAYHRTMAVQSAQSTTTRNFGGQLTEPAFAARPPPVNTVRPVQTATTSVQPPAPRPVTSTVARGPLAAAAVATNDIAFPPLSAQRVTQPPPRTSTAQARTSAAQGSQRPRQQAESSNSNTRPQMSDDARRTRHAAVITRAQNMLRQDAKKLEIFRANISRYRTNALSAADLIDAFWALFDVKAADLGKLINELAELFEDDTQRQDILKAWNNWKAINEDYPPFVGASSASTNTKLPTARVLNIKRSTASSGVSSTARAKAWGAAAENPGAAKSSFSNVPPSSSKVVPTTSRANPGPSWVPRASSSAGPSRVASKDEFPSLPPKKALPGWTPVAKKGQQQVVNAWDAGGEGSEGGLEPEAEEREENVGRKKGKGKQVLFRVGL